MLALFLATAATNLVTPPPASSSVVTIGGGFARSCYLAARAGATNPQALQNCDNAVAGKTLSRRDLVATHVNRGIIRMLRRDYPGARADFELAAQLDPGEAEAWLNLGILFYNQGSSGQAITMFDRAIERQTRLPALAHYGRGLAHEDVGNLRAAYTDFRQAQTLRPEWQPPATELRRYQVRRN